VVFEGAEVLTSLLLIEQAKESIQFIDKKTAPLQTAQGCRTPDLKITRSSAFTHPNNLLALQSVAHPAFPEPHRNSLRICAGSRPRAQIQSPHPSQKT
jgi:hypothetical protein